MPKIKKQPIETPVEQETVVAIEESVAKQEFRAFIEKLKVEKPLAYLKNKAELENKLNQL